MKLPFTIKELVEKSWDQMQVYTLSDKVKDQLINYIRFFSKIYYCSIRNFWKKHSLEKSQLLLIVEGELTNEANITI